MKKILVTPKASADLKNIGLHTEKKWGRKQRTTYLKKLNSRFSRLADNPRISMKREEIVGSPYSYHEERHVIFYRIISEGIEILRILHDSMDFPRHFK